jgi:hypothetical protein
MNFPSDRVVIASAILALVFRIEWLVREVARLERKLNGVVKENRLIAPGDPGSREWLERKRR